jgi:hypothetical protein
LVIDFILIAQKLLSLFGNLPQRVLETSEYYLGMKMTSMIMNIDLVLCGLAPPYVEAKHTARVHVPMQYHLVERKFMRIGLGRDSGKQIRPDQNSVDKRTQWQPGMVRAMEELSIVIEAAAP